MSPTEPLIKAFLAHNVPIYIQHLKDKGGVSPEEWQWLQCQDENPDYPMGLIMRADEFLLYPKNEKIFRKSMFTLILTLAIMAFFPGGVRMFGLEFVAEKEKEKQLEGET